MLVTATSQNGQVKDTHSDKSVGYCYSIKSASLASSIYTSHVDGMVTCVEGHYVDTKTLG